MQQYTKITLSGEANFKHTTNKQHVMQTSIIRKKEQNIRQHFKSGLKMGKNSKGFEQ